MPNQFNYTSGYVSMKALRFLKNKLIVGEFFNNSWSDEFAKEWPVGATINVPLPQRWITRRNTWGYSPQAISQLTTPLTVDQVVGLDFEWDSAEAALYMARGRQRIRETFVEPAMAQIAADIDLIAAEYAANNSNNIAGVLGTDPTDLSTFAAARQRMAEMGALLNSGRRGAIIAPQVNTSAVNAFKGLFEADDEISRQYKEGTLGRVQGFRYFESMSLKNHTAGTWQGAVTVSGAGQSGASLLVNCTSGDTFKKGDKIGIAAVYRVNPMTRQITTTASTMTVTVLADVTATASTATLSIYPALVGPGSPYQNVSALPANAAALTLFPGTSSPNGKTGKMNLYLQEDAFLLAGVRLEVPKQGAEIAEQTQDPDTGLSVRFIRQFDPYQSKMINRFDVMFGMARGLSDAASVVLLSA